MLSSNLALSSHIVKFHLFFLFLSHLFSLHRPVSPLSQFPCQQIGVIVVELQPNEDETDGDACM